MNKQANWVKEKFDRMPSDNAAMDACLFAKFTAIGK